jgi:hypothetical protein
MYIIAMIIIFAVAGLIGGAAIWYLLYREVIMKVKQK